MFAGLHSLFVLAMFFLWVTNQAELVALLKLLLLFLSKTVKLILLTFRTGFLARAFERLEHLGQARVSVFLACSLAAVQGIERGTAF